MYLPEDVIKANFIYWQLWPKRSQAHCYSIQNVVMYYLENRLFVGDEFIVLDLDIKDQGSYMLDLDPIISKLKSFQGVYDQN